jgi:multiple sugar transport system ATP-binding protein
VRELLWLERLGEATYLYLDSGTPGEPWVVKAPGPTTARPGQRVPVRLPASALHLFDADDQALPRCADTMATCRCPWLPDPPTASPSHVPPGPAQRAC